MDKLWHIYIVRCRDGTLYTGITDDLAKRMVAHNAGKGAKYTRGRGPVTLVYSEQAESHSQALRREYRIKQLSRVEKESVIAGQLQV